MTDPHIALNWPNIADPTRFSPAYALIVGDGVAGNLYTATVGQIGSVGSGIVNVKSAPYNAVGDGSNDTSALSSALLDGPTYGLVSVPAGTFRTTTQQTVPANTTLDGNGRSAVLYTTTSPTHLLYAPNAGALIRGMKFQGVAGGTVLNNSAVAYGNVSDVSVQDCEATGMSGIAFWAQGTNDHLSFFRNYVHGLTPTTSDINGSDIALIQGASYGTVAFNRLMGGGNCELGVLLQNTSSKHLVVGNHIGAHDSYGVIDYDNTLAADTTTNTIVALNRIEDTGAGSFGSPAGSKGAGIYTASTGGQIIALNQIRNTNIATTGETLVPGAVGINSAFSPLSILGNVIWVPNWYGVMVASSTSAIVESAHNVIFEPLKAAVNIKASSHVSEHGGSITMLTATPLTQSAVLVNTTGGGGPYTNVTIDGKHIRGSACAVQMTNTTHFAIRNNSISEVNGRSIDISSCSFGIISGNDCQTASASQQCLNINGVTGLTVTHNVFTSGSSTIVAASGNCTRSFFDKSNILSGGGDMNNVSNTSTGMIFEMYGTAAPTVNAHAVGDRVINKSPAVGSPKAWVCTVAGTPGTWVSEGNL